MKGIKMKITHEHYTHIKQAIEGVISQYGLEPIMQHKAKLVSGEIPCKDANTRLMYDLQRKAGLLSFVCDTIYKYADDTHYQTALFKAGKELNLI